MNSKSTANIKEKLGEEKFNELNNFFKSNYETLYEKKELTKAVETASEKYGISQTSINTKIIKPLKKEFDLRRPAKQKQRQEKGNITYSEEECKQLKTFYENSGASNFSQFIKYIEDTKVLGDRLASKSTIYKVLERAGLKNKKNGERSVEKTARQIEIVKMRKEGKTIAELVKAFPEITEQTIKIYLRTCLGESFSEAASLEFKKEVLDYYNKFGTGATTKKFNVPQSTQARWRKELKLSSRDNSESYRTYTLNENYLDDFDSADKCYILNLIATDGSINGNTISIELKKSDKELLEKVAICFGSNRPIEEPMRKVGEKSFPSAKFSINSKKLVNRLLDFGIGKNREKTINMKLDMIPIKFLADFWRGGIDGDGWITKFAIGLCGTMDYMIKFKDYVESILQNKKYTITHNNTTERNGIYQLAVQGAKERKILGDILYGNNPTLFLKRKQEAYKEWLKNSDEAETIAEVTNDPDMVKAIEEKILKISAENSTEVSDL